MLLPVFCIKLHISQRHPIHRAHIPGINQRLYLALYAVKGQQRDIRLQHAGFLIEPARQQKRIRVENIRRGAAPFFQPVILIANRLDAKRAMHASHIGNAVENLMEFQVIVSLLADRLSGRLVKGTVEHGCVHQIQRIAWKQRRNLRLGNIRRLAQKQRVIVRIGRAQLIIRQQMRIPAHFHLTINIGLPRLAPHGRGCVVVGRHIGCGGKAVGMDAILPHGFFAEGGQFLRDRIRHGRRGAHRKHRRAIHTGNLNLLAHLNRPAVSRIGLFPSRRSDRRQIADCIPLHLRPGAARRQQAYQHNPKQIPFHFSLQHIAWTNNSLYRTFHAAQLVHCTGQKAAFPFITSPSFSA